MAEGVSAIEQDWQIVELLVARLQDSGSTITYSELATRLMRDYEGREDARAWHYFDTALGRIQDVCVELGVPSLPVMVVRGETMKPGSGYAAYYRSMHPEAADLSDDDIARAQWNAVRTCEDWSALLDYYGIEFEFRGPKDVMAEMRAREAFEETSRITTMIQKEVKRNRQARQRCLELKGRTCVVCGFDSENKYGVPGIIHVHHLRPVYEMAVGETAKIDPEKDLVPVCPNCHALIHSKGGNDCYTPEEAKAMLLE